MGLALNNLQRLIYHKTQQSKSNQTDNLKYSRPNKKKNGLPNYVVIII